MKEKHAFTIITKVIEEEQTFNHIAINYAADRNVTIKIAISLITKFNKFIIQADINPNFAKPTPIKILDVNINSFVLLLTPRLR